MKILITVDPEIPIPPTNYGGIERIVNNLIDEYTHLNADVYLIAHKDSTNSKICKLFAWPANSSQGVINVLSNAIKLYKTYNYIQPDIVHSFSRLLYLYPLLFSKNNNKLKILQSYQRQINPRSSAFAHFIFGKKLFFTGCGEHLFKNLVIKKVSSTIYNFTDTSFYNDDLSLKKEYLMFLGRIEDIKGTKECIEAAIATKNKLIIAGNIPSGHEEYFDLEIKPYLENSLIKYVGPVNNHQKLYYLQRSKALLFPIKWEEPFGIVMAEAMACGTPVIGFNRGSVAEVIKNNLNGFIVENTSEMIAAVNKIDIIDRIVVRNDCESRFSSKIIARHYMELINTITK